MPRLGLGHGIARIARRGGSGATVPGAPTIGTATAGNAQATVTFTAPGSNGGSPITGYRVTSSPGGITATGAGSPITVTGLTNGTAYTFTVQAQNAIGFSAPSAASNSVTPTGVTFALSPRSLGPALTANGSGIVLTTSGTLQLVVDNGFVGFPAGEWVASGATATIGNGYEAVATLISGTSFSGNLNGVAVPLSANQSFLVTQAGSFSILIRVAGGGATVAGPVTITVT